LVLAQRLYKSGPEYGGAWNFGPNESDARSVQELIDLLIAHWYEPVQWMQDPREQPHEAQSLQLDCSKARHYLQWVLRWNLEQALTLICEWHRAHAHGDNLRHLSLQQIKRYQDS
jgi:CDP-glucose 4,6-dehydratase